MCKAHQKLPVAQSLMRPPWPAHPGPINLSRLILCHSSPLLGNYSCFQEFSAFTIGLLHMSFFLSEILSLPNPTAHFSFIILKWCLQRSLLWPSWAKVFRPECVSQSPEDIWRHSCWTAPPEFLIQRVCSGKGECVFLTSSQVLLKLLVRGPHFKNHFPRESQPCTTCFPNTTCFSFSHFHGWNFTCFSLITWLTHLASPPDYKLQDSRDPGWFGSWLYPGPISTGHIVGPQ